MRKPDFIIAGTQKGGTTWLEHNLARHPTVVTPHRQLHYFDRNYSRGLDWYCSFFSDVPLNFCAGEKTTEYFDPNNVDVSFSKMARDLPNIKVFILLRDPVQRALSALAHCVYSGVVPLPHDPDQALFADFNLPLGEGQSYIERGFYDQQLEKVYMYLKPSQVCVLVFEEDIIADPFAGWSKACSFLGIKPLVGDQLEVPVNMLRLSKSAIRAARIFYGLPMVGGIVRRLDKILGLPKWRPSFQCETLKRLRAIYAPKNEELFARLGRRIPAWEID